MPYDYYVQPLKGGACGNIKERICLKEQLPLIKCECGAEILLIPSIDLMSRAIEAHITEHVKNEKDKSKIETISEHIRTLLIAQVLEKASKIK